MLPVLILETTCSALVLLDGTPLGESGPGQPVTLPLSPSCVHYLEARPLVPGRIPLTRRFELDGSELDPTSLAGDVRARLWPGCFALYLDPPAQYRPGESPFTLAVQELEDGLLATLYQDGGLHLALERGEELLLTQSLGAGMSGELHLAGEYLVALTEDACLCIHCGKEPSVTLSLQGGRFTLEEDRVRRVQELDTLLGHRRTQEYTLDGSQLSQTDSPPYRSCKNGAECAVALLDALRLHMDGQVGRYLFGDLSALTPAELRTFFGDYSHALAHPFCREGETIVGLCGEERVAVMRLYLFDARKIESGWLLYNAEEF